MRKLRATRAMGLGFCGALLGARIAGAKADFVWDDARLDAWLANPQTIIPGAIMAYRQPKAETRTAIIAISRS